MKTPEEKRAYSREYMKKYNATEKGKEYNRAHKKAWREAGNRKPEKRQMTKEYREIIINFCLERDGPLCQSCGQTLAETEIGINHIIPAALGGTNTMGNINLVHRSCNSSVGNIIRQQLRDTNL